MTRYYLSLGSNQEPERHLAAALDELAARFGTLEVSDAWRFPAVGFDGPAFVNLAAGVETDLDPEALNDWLHALEDRHGRRRDVPRYSDRTLDVDIVLCGERVAAGRGNLKIPRDELAHAFVLKPLAQIAPDAVHPVRHETLATLWQRHPDHGRTYEPVMLRRRLT
jgi:2-amino-4-hydroxy-6-hydroxymethyldihydropteridine diphosphokinase